ncbi:MAG: hypothetical protein PHR47_01060 [Candidatus Pacebacteria bacterium]|nr:hypothetical protein [Candidatus Paceibacterota bacterium]
MKNNIMNKVRLCKSCIRNINSKYISSIDGECEYCRMFIKYKRNIIGRVEKIEGKFNEDLNNIKRKGDYDCLVMVSGGKDSVMTLYKIKKETGLRPLAYTFDNGFEPEQAMENIKNAVERLEVDWFIDKPSYVVKVLKTVLREKIKVSICRFCSFMMISRAINIAHFFNIPCIVTGWNKGQSDKEPSRFPLWNIPKEKIDELLQNYPFMRDIGLCDGEKEKMLLKYGIEIMSPWIYEKRNNKDNMKILEKELGWKKVEQSYPKNSTSCYLNLLQVIISRKYFGYTHYDCEESVLINHREKTKEEAIETNNFDIDTNKVNDVLKKLQLGLNDLGITKDEIEKYSKFYF